MSIMFRIWAIVGFWGFIVFVVGTTGITIIGHMPIFVFLAYAFLCVWAGLGTSVMIWRME